MALAGTLGALFLTLVLSWVFFDLTRITGFGAEENLLLPFLAGDIDLIINTPFGVGPRLDGYEIRTAAVLTGVPCITTIQGLSATVLGIEALLDDGIGVRSLQEHSADLQRLRDFDDTRTGEVR